MTITPVTDDAGIARRRSVVADGADLEPEHSAGDEDIHGRDCAISATMRPACRRIRSTSGGSEPASRIGSLWGQPPPIGSFNGPFEHHLHKEEHDEIQKQRRHDLVDAEPHLQQRRPEHQQGACKGRRPAGSAGRGRRTAPSMAPVPIATAARAPA